MEMHVDSFVMHLLERKGRLPVDFDDQSDFIAAGIIDSIGIIKFVLEIEQKFDVEISDQDIASEHFRTIRGVSNLVQRKLQQRGAQA